MIPFIKKLLGIHVHTWSPWKTTQTFIAESTGEVIVIQARCCTVCLKAELSKSQA